MVVVLPARERRACARGLFEVIEAFAAQIVNPELGAAYLGTQGDEWDAQKDMAAAFAGAAVTMILTLMANKILPR